MVRKKDSKVMPATDEDHEQDNTSQGNGDDSSDGLPMAGSVSLTDTAVARHKAGGGHVLFTDIERMKAEVRHKLTKKPYDVKEFYWKTGVWQAIARHPTFENTTLGVIAVNALWMWVDTDGNQADTLLEAESIFVVAENLFCVYFSFEWFARFMSFRRKRDGLKDNWFIFDSVLVFMMVAETWFMTLAMLIMGGGGKSPLGNASILRLLRLARLSRMARMLRSMPELLILCKGMAKAMHTVGFVVLLLVILLYVFSIAFVQLLKGTEIGYLYFDKIFPAMYILLVTGTFLDNITQVTTELMNESPAVMLLFFVFVSLSALMVMNMLIGVLCEVVSAVAETEKEEMLLSFVKERMKKVLATIDEDQNETVSKAEFAQILQHQDAVLALDEVGVDPVSLVDFMDQIFDQVEGDDDDNASEEPGLTFKQFMDVVLRYRGSNLATQKDLIDHRKWLTQFVRTSFRKQAEEVQQLVGTRLLARRIQDMPASKRKRMMRLIETIEHESFDNRHVEGRLALADLTGRPQSRATEA